MLRDAIFLIFGLILMYVFIMLYNYGFHLPKKVAVPLQQHVQTTKKVPPKPTPSLSLAPTTFQSVDQQYLLNTFGKQTNIALAVAKASSGLDCKYDDGNGDVGLFAINVAAHPFGFTDSKNCETNIDMAKKIYDTEGWDAFSHYKDGTYKNFL